MDFNQTLIQISKWLKNNKNKYIYIYDNQGNFNTYLIFNDIKELLLIVLGRIMVLSLHVFSFFSFFR